MSISFEYRVGTQEVLDSGALWSLGYGMLNLHSHTHSMITNSDDLSRTSPYLTLLITDFNSFKPYNNLLR